MSALFLRPMKLLALDTSSEACSVALLIGNEIKAIHEIAPMQQAKKILPLIDQLLKENSIKLHQLDALAFGCGPGSFTGVRIATSVAQGLGFAAQLPLIPISSLAALAQTAYQNLGWEKLLVAIDARVQEVYSGMYQANTAGLVELIGIEKVSAPKDMIIEKFISHDWYGVGNGWEIYRHDISFKPLKIDTTQLPTASAILMLAKVKYEKKDWVYAKEALPTYLRDEVAQKS